MSLAKGTLSQVAHVVRVKSLYKNLLKQACDWYVNRTDFIRAAVMIRETFDKNKHERDVATIDRMVQEGVDTLWRNRHPDPYIIPDNARYEGVHAKIGSSWMRNPPPPTEILTRELPPLYRRPAGQEDFYKNIPPSIDTRRL